MVNHRSVNNPKMKIFKLLSQVRINYEYINKQIILQVIVYSHTNWQDSDCLKVSLAFKFCLPDSHYLHVIQDATIVLPSINEDRMLVVTTHLTLPGPSHSQWSWLPDKCFIIRGCPSSSKPQTMKLICLQMHFSHLLHSMNTLHNIFKSNMDCTSPLIKPCLKTNQTQTRHKPGQTNQSRAYMFPSLSYLLLVLKSKIFAFMIILQADTKWYPVDELSGRR